MKGIIVLLVATVLNQLLLNCVEADNCTVTRYGLDVDNPGTSCDDIFEKNPSSRDKSGNYLIKTDQLQLVYCEVKTWIEVVDFNTSKQITCPEGWATVKANDLRMCGPPSSSAGCYSTIFSLDNRTSYYEIRGLVRGYQKGTTDSFDNRHGFRDINTTYVDGVSITLGSARKHVWTYVAGCSDEGHHSSSNCPCALYPGPSPPSFVGDHFYCESGSTSYPSGSTYYTDDPLWDGASCGKGTCCSNNELPWFHRTFSEPQNDYIEVRICTDESRSNEAVLVDQLQLYVK